MAKALIAVGTLLVACILGLAGVAYLTRQDDKLAIDAILSENVTKAVALAEERDGGRLDLRRLAPFAWDSLLLVERGTPPEAISRALGFEWRGDVAIELGDVLVFVRGRHVVRYAEYRGDGAFAGVRRPFDRFPRRDAVFTVRALTIRPARPSQ